MIRRIPIEEKIKEMVILGKCDAACRSFANLEKGAMRNILLAHDNLVIDPAVGVPNARPYVLSDGKG